MQEWFTQHRISDADSAALRQPVPSSLDSHPIPDVSLPPPTTVPSAPVDLPEHIRIHVAEPIIDRKSSFVGRAVEIKDVADVSRSKTKPHSLPDTRLYAVIG